MTSLDWPSLLAELSRLVLAKDAAAFEEYGFYQVPEEYHQRGYLGFPGATEKQLSDAEARLGIRLPPYYRAFLTASNGWGEMGAACPGKMWPTEEIEWLRIRNRDMIEMWDDDSLSPEEHLAARYEGVLYNGKYMWGSLEVSDVFEGQIIFLSPEVVDLNGEWELWDLATWRAGICRYQSFSDWMLKTIEAARSLTD